MNTQANNPQFGSNNTRVFLLLLLFATLFRAPWFFQDVINWDESVFILVGDALAHGHLPYTLVWDNKPPLGFALYAFLIALVPHSLAFIRFGGAVVVGVAALLVFRVSIRLMAGQYAFVSAASFVIAASVLITGGMAVMMEHVALVPLLGASVVLGDKAATNGRLCAVGSLLAAAALVRPNLAFVPIVLLLVFPAIGPHPGFRHRMLATVYIALGGLAVLAAVFLIYSLDGHARLLFDSMVRVPLAYSRSGMGRLAATQELFRYAFRVDDAASILEPRRALSALFWTSGAVGIALLAFSRRYRGATAAFLVVFVLATSFSMVSSGLVWEHHLIQVAPFFAIGAGALLSTVRVAQMPRIAIAAIWVLAIGFTITRLSFYKGLYQAYASHAGIYTGDTFAVARHLRQVASPDDTLFVTNDILLYWLMDTYPPTPVSAFPANLWEEKGILEPLYGPAMTTDAALQEVIARQPTRIVLPAEGPESRIGHDPRRVFPRELLEGYYLEDTVSGRLIYRRKRG